MEVKTRKSKVLALVLSMLIALAFMPAIASAAVSTGLDFSNKGGSPGVATETYVGATGKDLGYIAAKATGDDLETDKVTCTSNDESIATVVDQNKADSQGYWKFDIVGQKAGTTTITVTANDNPANTAEVPVIVTAGTADITLDFNSPLSLNTAVGAQKGGLIAVYAKGGTEEFGQVECVSDDPTIATVTPTGKQMQGKWWKFDVNGLKKGETFVTVTAVEDRDVQEIVRINVVEELITVKYGDFTKGYNLDEFNALPTVEVPQWAGRNHYFTFLSYPTDSDASVGPTVETILVDALGEDGYNALSDDQLISFIPSDNPAYTATFTIGQILRTPRYYFPNSADLKEGGIATKAQLADAIETPTVICQMDNTDSRLVLGQVAPNERSVAVSAKCMSTGGTIEISDEKATKLTNDVTASIASGSNVKAGAEIKLNSPTMLVNEIYYTTNGNTPSVEKSALYNYCTKGDYATAKITAPKKLGPFTVKVMQYIYGSNPSAVKTFKYTVPATKGNTYAVNSQKYKVTKVATANAKGTVTLTKSKNAKSVTVPKAVKLADGRTYNVTAVAAKAFTPTKVRTVYIGANVTTLKPYALKGSKATKVVVKTKKFKKTTVKKSLKGSKVKYVVVKVGTKKQNKTYVTKYKKFFTKANAGRKVTVK
ncbi:MAG: chitobiase/beta-hexosaminidase C-terminal domain-containing protein [Firmicutes bacterium]|nr:chitobiase/beta-hexosaminidase C-terminal domain-containing protein [Bacillota bacterium]